jgi:hypothetical protein
MARQWQILPAAGAVWLVLVFEPGCLQSQVLPLRSVAMSANFTGWLENSYGLAELLPLLA